MRMAREALSPASRARREIRPSYARHFLMTVAVDPSARKQASNFNKRGTRPAATRRRYAGLGVARLA